MMSGDAQWRQTSSHPEREQVLGADPYHSVRRRKARVRDKAPSLMVDVAYAIIPPPSGTALLARGGGEGASATVCVVCAADGPHTNRYCRVANGLTLTPVLEASTSRHDVMASANQGSTSRTLQQEGMGPHGAKPAPGPVTQCCR